MLASHCGTSKKLAVTTTWELCSNIWKLHQSKGKKQPLLLDFDYEAAGKGESSIRSFFESNAFKALLGAAPEFAAFAVENAQKPIIGIPAEIAEEYWFDQATKGSSLPRGIIPIGSGIEVFGLPGFELRRGRYLLSETNAAEAVGKTNNSIINFLRSNAFKALLGARPELSIFTVENAQKPIIGIPVGRGVEVFGLPGFEKKRGRYLLSMTNAAEAAGKPAMSISRFLESSAFKALLHQPSEFLTFVVENAQKPIIGIPPEIAEEY